MQERSDSSRQEFERALFRGWSSHPQSLDRQKLLWFLLGLAPLILLVVFAVFSYSEIDAVLRLFRNPQPRLIFAASVFCLSLGATLAFALQNLMARGAFKAKAGIRGADSSSITGPMLLVLSFFWLVPVALSYLQDYLGWNLIPGLKLFLDLLCFAPFVVLLLWVLTTTTRDEEGKGEKKVRRQIWLVLGTLFLALFALSFLDSVVLFIRGSRLISSISWASKLTNTVIRVILIATLLPLSLACYAVWLLFRRAVEENKPEFSPSEAVKQTNKSGKGVIRRFLDWLFGHKTETIVENTNDKPQPPEWVFEFIRAIPAGIELQTQKPGEPDQLSIGETSPFDESEDGKALAFLMTGTMPDPRRQADSVQMGLDSPTNVGACSDNDGYAGQEGEVDSGDEMAVESKPFLPTKSQTKFFARFRDVYLNALKLAENGKSTPVDMILSGAEGSGRSELLRACALFAAFSRGQHVLYVVPDLERAEFARKRFQDCIDRMMMSCYITCEVLDIPKVIRWMDGVRSDEKEIKGEPIPTILIATPSDIEGGLFDNDLAVDESSFNQLRHVIQTFEVLLVDDFIEYDATERAHLTFVIHKFQALFAHKHILPQIVVVTPPLLPGLGRSELGDKLFGGTNFDLDNQLEIKPRAGEEGTVAWQLPVRVTAPGGTAKDACDVLVRKCLELNLDVVMYRKGVSTQQCEDARAALVEDIGTGSLRIVSKLEQLGPDVEPDAVFYLAALCGEAGISIRLNLGDSPTVFIRISGSETECFRNEDIIPVLPDSSAISLRIHHLRSLLRFITPNEPLPESVWQFFGVSKNGCAVASVRRSEDLVPSVEWVHDSWDEPEVYKEPLQSLVYLDGASVLSNAGIHVRFTSLPSTRENLFRIAGQNRIILGVPAPQGGKEDLNEERGRELLAKWTESKENSATYLASCDLAHAERLILFLGASEGKNSVNVHTIKEFGPGDDTCCAQIIVKRWEGDGTDYDTPVRALSWTIEPVSSPVVHPHPSSCTFLGFDLPDCRGLPRYVSASITGLVNAWGDLNDVPDPPQYRYRAYVSAMVLLPKSLPSSTKEAYVQRFSAGAWTAGANPAFSPVLTHLFAGVLRHVIPDFSFFATCPAFHVSDREDSIGAAVIWFLEPANSGKVLDDILSKFFDSAASRKTNPFEKSVGGKSKIFSGLFDNEEDCDSSGIDSRSLVKAMLAVLKRVRAKGGAEAQLKWLRTFSSSAFDTPLKTPEDRTRFEADLEKTGQILEKLLKRIEEGYKPSDEDNVAPLSGNRTWIVRPKDFGASPVAGTTEWETVATLPEGFTAGAGAKCCSWTVHRKDMELSLGFAERKSHELYERFLNGGHWKSRISVDSYVEYGENDPYREALDSLYSALEERFRLQGKKIEDSNKRELAEFLLCFVQGGIDYIEDPKLVDSDWPRFPTETLSLLGGDCEDSSILYIELLRRAGIGCALLSVPHHAAVGVCVNMQRTEKGKTPVAYSWLGERYVYAETATSKGSYVPLGEETELIPSADSIPANVVVTPPSSPSDNVSVRILNVRYDRKKFGVMVSVLGTGEAAEGDHPLCVACFVRTRKGVFDEPEESQNHPIAVIDLPRPAKGEVKEGFVRFPSDALLVNCWLDVFVCESDSGVVRGHFVGAARFAG